MQAVARLARVAVADVVGQDDEELRGVERLARPEQLAGELARPTNCAAGAAGAVHDQHRVAHHALRVLRTACRGAVVHPQLGQRLAGREPEVSEDVVAFSRRGGSRLRLHQRDDQRGQEGEERHLKFESSKVRKV